MNSHTRRVAALSLVAGGIAGGPVAAAQASNASLRATVKRDVPRITESQARILTGMSKLQRTHSPRALIRAIRAQDRNLTALKRRLAPQSASTPVGGRAKYDILKGLTLIVASNDTIARDLAKLASHRAVSKRQLVVATLVARKGNRDLVAGARLLKVR